MQHPVQANDKEFKGELSRIAEMTIWDTAKGEASEQLSKANKQQVQLEQQLLVRTEYVIDLTSKVRACPLKSPALDISTYSCLMMAGVNVFESRIVKRRV